MLLRNTVFVIALALSANIPALALWQSGLYGGTVSGSNNFTNFPASSSVYSSPHAAATNKSPPWAGSITWVYWGEMYFNGETYHFAENMDDYAWLKIDGTIYMNDGQPGTPTKTGPIVLTQGWHYVEMRFGNGGGGAGAVAGSGWTATKGFGYNINGNNTANGNDYDFPDDSGSMLLFRHDDGLNMLAHPMTGSTRFTNSNINDVVWFPAYTNFTVYQITADEADAVDAPESWLSMTSPPAQVTFTDPPADTNVITTVWYTNLAASVPLICNKSSIYYTKVAPTPLPHATLKRHLVNGYSTVVLTAAEVDNASSGGTANSMEMSIFTRRITCAADATPEAPYITLVSTGVYDVAFEVVNEAGNSAFATAVVTVVEGELRTWSGLGGNTLASNKDNWSPAEAPVSGNSVRFDGSATTNCAWDLDIVVAAWEQTAGYTGSIVFRTLYPGQGNFTNLVIARDVSLSGGAWTHTANSGGQTEVNRLCVTIGGNFSLTSPATVNVDGKGYDQAMGPGAGGAGAKTAGFSASHGGAGASNPAGSLTYGSAVYPESLGSGAYGRGGGAVKIVVGGTATINGAITARGVNPGSSDYCHGAGGSICIMAHNFAGSGTIDAGIDTSRSGYYGSAGGRVALHSATTNNFAGLSVDALHNTAQNRSGYGRSGTVLLSSPGGKRLIVNQDNKGTASDNYTFVPAQLPPPPATHPAHGGEMEDVTLVITNGAFVRMANDLRVNTVGWLKGTLSLNAFTLYCKETRPPNFPVNQGNGTITSNGVFYTFDDGYQWTLPGRIVWTNTPVSWRVAALALPAAGGTLAIDGGGSSGYFPDSGIVEAAATAAMGYSFGRWEGNIAAADETDNPLELGPLDGNVALRALFRDNSLGSITNTWINTPSSDDWFDPRNWSLIEVPQTGQVVVVNNGAAILLTNTTAQLNELIMNGGTLSFANWTTGLKAAKVNILGGIITSPVAVPNGTATNRVNIACQSLYLASGAQINVDGCGYGGGRDPGGNSGTYVNGKGPGAGKAYGGSGSYGGQGGLALTAIDSTPDSGPTYGSPAAPLGPGSGGGTGDSRSGRHGGHGGGSIRIDAGIGQVVVNGTITANSDAPTDYASSGSGGAIWITCGTFAATNATISADSTDDISGVVARGGGGGGRIAVVYDRALQNSLPVPTATFTAKNGKSLHTTAAKIDGDIGTLYFTDARWFTNGVINNHIGKLHFADDIDSISFSNLTVENAWIRLPDNLQEINISGNLTVGANGRLDIGGSSYYTVLGFWELRNPQTHTVLLNVGGGVSVVDGGYLRLVSAAASVAAYIPGIKAVIDGALTVDGSSTLRLVSSVTNGASAHVSCAALNVAAGGLITANGAGFAGRRGSSGIGYGPGAALGGGGHGGAGGKSGSNNGGVAHDDPLKPYNCGTGGGCSETGVRIGTAGNYGGGRIRLSVKETALVNGTIEASGGPTRGGYSSGGAGGTIYIDCRRLQGNGLLKATGGNGGTYGSGGGGRIAVWYGQPYEEGVTPLKRLSIEEAVPVSGFDIDVNVAGGTGDNPGGVGSIRFVKVAAAPGTALLLR